MGKRKQRTPGELIYLSTAKLREMAPQLGTKTRSFKPSELEGSATAEVGAPDLGKVGVGGRISGSRIEVGVDERVNWEVLQKVLKRMGDLRDLEAGDLIREGEWFRFHRNLKFGVGRCDAEPSIKALVVVDREPISQGSLPGLLMNGSIRHVLEPYAGNELPAAQGDRSGSGTDRLFNWLEEVRKAREATPTESFRTILSRIGPAPKDAQTALGMYTLFAREEWLSPYFAEPLMHGAPCEGVAQASFSAIGEERAVMMATPLFIRRCPLAGENDEDGVLSRLFGR
ncbi:MAG TPA: SAVMC3_10250 family protein [Solirubrobacterales bacterium]|nr:SAVMC3_10250 family protein [Solirubrobacterales bacterium]